MVDHARGTYRFDCHCAPATYRVTPDEWGRGSAVWESRADDTDPTVRYARARVTAPHGHWHRYVWRGEVS